MNHSLVITALAENILTTVQRIVSLLLRHRIKVEEVRMVEKKLQRTSCLIIVVQTDKESVDKLMKQLKKLTGLINVQISYNVK